MPTWPRTILPRTVTVPEFPGGLSSWGQSGKGQFRSTTQVGRVWEEIYPPLADGAATKEFLALINKYWRERTIFDIDHRLYLTSNGTPGGTPLVNGASQTGSSLVTNGWTVSTLVLKAGDVISVVGVAYVLDVTADVTSDGAGAATISISPPIFSGGSPADDAVISHTGVTFSCVLAAKPNIPQVGPGTLITGLRLMFREEL